MASILEIIVSQKKQGSGIKKSEKDVKSLDKSLKNMKVAMVAGAASAVAIGVALKKAFDLGREGAVVAQTAESFDFLLEKIGVAPDLLDDLRASARGTVDDMTLMSSTMTLVAGAGDELGAALLQSTPQLLDIAKAANKLNPALGDTAFFYESIATGVKRAQPLILDNLGLTIKVGAANEAFAAKLGKSVDALTAEEKQMAILEDVFRAGDEIIKQVGGNTDAATDSFDRLTVALKNSGDEAKKSLFVGIEPLVEGLANSVETHNLFTKARKEGLITEEEMIDLIVDSTTALELNEAATELLTERSEARAIVLERTAQFERQFARGLGDTAGAAKEAGDELEQTEEQLLAFENALKTAEAAGQSMRDALTDPISVRVTVDAPDMIQQLGLNELGITNIEDSIPLIMSPVLDKEDAARFAREAELIEVAAQVRVEAIEVPDAIKQLVADGIAPNSTQAREMLQPLLDISPEAFNVMGQILKSKLVNAVNDAAREMRESLLSAFRPAVSPLLDAVEKIKALHNSTIVIKVNFERGFNIPEGKHGLDMTVPAGFPNDSFPVLASSGERVQITPAGATTTSNLTTGDISVNVAAGTDGGGIVDEIMDELGRRVRQASSSGAGFVGS